jgi:Leucine-rich repeat (LRR) protein
MDSELPEPLLDALCESIKVTQPYLSAQRLAVVPAELSELRDLQVLLLHGNQLSNSLESIEALTELRAVELSGNFDLAALRRLDLILTPAGQRPGISDRVRQRWPELEAHIA